MATALGNMKIAAARIGVDLEEYEHRRAAGEKWCTACKAWHKKSAFPRDRTRSDGRRARCLTSDRGTPRWPRDPMHDAARVAVNREVAAGRLPRASDLPCEDCGYHGAERRREYDHHRGYAPEYRLDVQAVCTICHAERERNRRNG